MNNYRNLISFNFGKRRYDVMMSDAGVVYFENINGEYSKSVVSFSLFDNEGKSLTLVNQHFFMSELVNKVNVAFKKGFLVSDSDIINYLTNIKTDAESNINLKQLFKGSLMNQIDEANFEDNKRKIVSYLDAFKYDEFKYNDNVSVFSGSLEKNPIDMNSSNTEFVDSINDNNIQENVGVNNSLNNSFDFNTNQFDVSSNNQVSDVSGNQVDSTNRSNDISSIINSISASQANGTMHVGQSAPVNTEGFVDSYSEDSDSDFTLDMDKSFMISKDNFDEMVRNYNSSVEESPVAFDNTSNQASSSFGNVDYHQDVFDNNQVNMEQNMNNSFDNNQVNMEQNMNNSFDNSQVFDNFNQNTESNTNSAFDNQVFNMNQSVDNQVAINNVGMNPVDNQMSMNSFDNNTQGNFDNTIVQSLDSQVNANNSFGIDSNVGANNVGTSYIDQVKNRLQSENTQEQADREYGAERVENTIIQDKSMLPDLDSVVESDTNVESKKGKKGNVGMILFIIFLILVLFGFGFYLYNIVF